MVMSKINESYRTLLILYSSFPLAGLLESYYSNNETILLSIIVTHGLAIVMLIYRWCGEYSQEKNINEIGGVKLLAGFIPLIGVPIYLLRHFGFKKGSMLSVFALIYIIISFYTNSLVHEIFENTIS